MGTRTTRAAVAALLLTLGSLAACTSDGASDTGGDGASTTTEAADVELTGTIELDVEDPERCDPIADGCLLPFPNDLYTTADDTTPTGRRVALARESLPANVQGVHIDPAHWNDLDGFSPSAAAIVQIPDVDLEASGAAPVTDLAASLADDSPVVVVDATAGERLAHWVELDAAAPADEVPTLYVRPAAAFPEGHRIVVGLRGLVDGDGTAIEPTDAFRAYRDRLESDVEAVEARRPAMEQIFADLDDARVDRDDLVVAWDFTVASAEALSGRLLHLRDDAFGELGDDAPAFTVATNDPSDREGIAREVTGTYEVPSYLTEDGGPGTEFVLDDDGRPTRTGAYTANFRCVVPASATAADPAGTGLYGHGLLGSADQVPAASSVAVAGNRVFCGTDLIGMSEADIGNAARIVGEFSTFNTLADRLQQGHLNTLFLGRLLVHPDGFGSDPAFQDAGASVLTDDLVYYGLSQGGIMGGATTAVAQDWTLAVLGVPAMNYGLLLDRSVDFDDFRAIMEPSYPSAADRALALQLVQMLWDRGEASGYAQHLTADPYPDTPEHRVLLQSAFGDHQVANVATDVQARTIGAAGYRPVLAAGRSPEEEPFWGIEEIGSFPFEGSAVVLFDSGAASPPVTNTAPREGEDPHSDPRADADVVRQIAEFLATGSVIDVCDGGPCTVAPRD